MVRQFFSFSHPGCHQRKLEQRLIFHPKILNLSVIPSPKNQIKLLSKGLKFTQTPKLNIPGIKINIADFTRKLSLREFLANENDSNEN